MPTSEMISNYFFLTHSYSKAVPRLEAILEKEPGHLKARKKLIIAYIETGHLRRAYELFVEMMLESPRTILDTNPEAEDCPCPELLLQVTEHKREFDDPANRHLVAGIYAAYCDLAAAIAGFREYSALVPDDSRAREILALLNAEIAERI